MAISRGAGTEIIRSAHFEDMDNATDLIIGVQHHIYTVLSIIVCTRGLDATTDVAQCWLTGWDSHGGASAQNIHIFTQNIQLDETFVWNDKFSFNGFEPLASSMSGALTTTAEQDAIADQGSAVPQKLVFSMNSDDGGGQDFDVHITYIDQNNA
jgi:hypothetical protein